MDGVRLVHSVLMDRIAHYPEALSPYLSQLLPLGRIQSRQADDGPVELIVLFYKLGIGIGQRLQSLVPPLPLCRPLQRVIELMQEKIEFFKTNSGKTSIEYNVISGQLSIMNEKQQIICQRNNPKIDLFKEFGVNEEDAQYIRVLLHQTSVQNKEISVQIKAVVENDGRMYKLKLHTLWSPLKKDGYIGIIGYFDTVK